MDKFINLYNFIDFAKTNRKYPESTANNLKSALKIFEKELNAEELKSISMVENTVNEIFRSVVIANKEKSIISLNTYKARLLKVIKDYKKYGANPSKMQSWIVKTRKSSPTGKQIHQSTPLLIKKDKQDKDNKILSNFIEAPVYNCYKIEFSLREDAKAVISVPKDISLKEIKIIKAILDSLSTQE
jgi:hypothetical protein